MVTEQQVRQVLTMRATGRSSCSIADELGLSYSTTIAISNGTHHRHIAPEMPRFKYEKPYMVSSSPQPADLEQRRERAVVHVLSSLGMSWREIAILCPVPMSKEYARKIAYGKMHVKIAAHMERMPDNRLAAGAACSGCRFYHEGKPDLPCDLEIPELSPKRCGSFFPNT
jgi:hypothetical protein